MASKEHTQDAVRKGLKRKNDRDLSLDPPVDLAQRRACIADPILFMRTYFGWIFTQEFVPSRKAMVGSIIHAARYGGDYAVAAGRGSGKSGIALFTGFWLVIRGEVVLPLIIGKNQKGAENELSNLKQAIVESPSFAEDFPEICKPIIELEDWASTARKQTVNGCRTKIGWEKDCLFLPTVPLEALPNKWPKDEPTYANGQGIAVVGIDGKVRGFKRRNTRPGLAIIDDIDDRESARSETQTADLRDAIDKDVIGLAGSGKRTSRVMLCTTLNKTCVAAIYTELSSWRGQRFKAITKMPPNESLREEYIEMRKSRDKDDPDARKAHDWYLERQVEIERDGEVDNQFDFVSKLADDGRPLEVSSLQHYYNLISDIGWTPFLCEFQNDPPDENEQEGTQITQKIVAKRISGIGHLEIPHDKAVVVAFMDVGDNVCYFTESAWFGRAIGCVTDYGTYDVPESTTKHNAWKKVFHEWRQSLMSKYQWNGQTVLPSVVLIDSGDGDHKNAVYEFCREVGAPFFPSKGMKDNWQPPRLGQDVKQSAKRGDHWAIVPQDDSHRTRLREFHATFWKQFCHRLFMTPTFDENNQRRDGSIAIYVCPDQMEIIKKRREYTHQIVGEVWGAKKQGGKMEWLKTGKNHFLDATAGNCLAANIAGIKLQEAVQPKGPRPSLSDLANKAKRVA